AGTRCRSCGSRYRSVAWSGSAPCTPRLSCADADTRAPASPVPAPGRSLPAPTPACCTPTGPTRPATASTSPSGTGRSTTAKSTGSAEPAVGEARQFGPDGGEPVHIEVGERDAGRVRGLGEDGAPRVDHHAAAE